MKFSYNWLSDLVDLKRYTPESLAEGINSFSFEVEGIERIQMGNQHDFVLMIDFGKTNRVDIASHLGMAAEISAITGRPLLKDLSGRRFVTPRLRDRENNLKLESDRKLSQKYTLTKFSGAKISASPEWLAKRLVACGLKPINNVVDIANYVMLETGQPLHAFDADKVLGKTIWVRNAKKGEKLTTLDNETVELLPADIVIADKSGPIALAGIKGGKSTGITEKTKDILLESANFNPISVRKTSWRLGLRTDAAHRFERRLSPSFVEPGLARAAELLDIVAYAKPVETALANFVNNKKTVIILDAAYPTQLLGMNISRKTLDQIFNRLHFRIERSHDRYRVQIPPQRVDLSSPEDLVEEIGRLVGYDRIPEVKPQIPASSGRNQGQKSTLLMRNLLAGLGFHEVYNYSFYGEADTIRYNLSTEEHFELANPLSEAHKYMRISLLPNLFKSFFSNFRFWKQIAIFEIGNVYLKNSGENFHDAPRLALCSGGEMSPKSAFLDLKGKVQALFENLHIKYKFHADSQEGASHTPTGFYSKNGKHLGTIDVGTAEGAAVAVAEFDLTALSEAIPSKLSFQEFSKMPAVGRDVAIIVDRSVLWADVVRILDAVKLLKGYNLFDVYEGKQIPEGKKSLAFSLEFQAMEKTLLDADVNRIMQNIIKDLQNKLGAKVR